jgi:adenine-specific DNA-methyltransferase
MKFMKKMKMQLSGKIRQNIVYIREHFPFCVTELKNEQGELALSVNFNLLQRELSESVIIPPPPPKRILSA